MAHGVGKWQYQRWTDPPVQREVEEEIVEMTKVVSKCARCGENDEFQIPSSVLAERSRGVPIRQAFRDLPPQRIRQFLEHICPNCQNVEGKGDERKDT